MMVNLVSEELSGHSCLPGRLGTTGNACLLIDPVVIEVVEKALVLRPPE